MRLSEIVVDVEREQQGDWIEIPSMAGVSVKVRSIYSKDYRRALQMRLRKLQRQYGSEPIPPEVSERSSGKLVADHLLLDWRGLTDDDDNPVPYTKELGFEVMTDPQYRKLADGVSWATGMVGELDASEAEEDLGNSEPSSAGT